MANVIVETNLSALEKALKDIVTTAEKITNDDTVIKENVGLSLISDLTKTINEKYNSYLTSISNYEHEVSDITTSVTDTKKGYVLHVKGKDILYHEYGTGTRGLRKPHPSHDSDGMKPYGSGKNIIQYGVKNINYTPKKDGGSRFDTKYEHETPYWYRMYRDFPGYYPNDFGDANIRPSDYVWRHNGVITKGLPAGRFIYDSCEEYRKSTGLGEKTVLKNTITQLVKKEFVNKMKKETKQKIVQSKPEIKLKVARDIEEYAKLEAMRKAAGF